MKNKRTWLFVCFFIVSEACFAQSFGNYGEVFPVIEDDFRQFIQARLESFKASGKLKTLKKEAISRVTKSTLRPKSLGLTVNDKSKTYFVSPEITLTHDIRLPNGQLIAAKGTVINPMKQAVFNSALIFFDGDDERQVRWVKTHYQKFNSVKFILTNGDIKDASKLFGRIYFDQKGLITNKLKIRHVPSTVVQENQQWKIRVIGEKELTHA